MPARQHSPGLQSASWLLLGQLTRSSTSCGKQKESSPGNWFNPTILVSKGQGHIPRPQGCCERHRYNDIVNNSNACGGAKSTSIQCEEFCWRSRRGIMSCRCCDVQGKTETPPLPATWETLSKYSRHQTYFWSGLIGSLTSPSLEGHLSAWGLSLLAQARLPCI